MSSQSTAESLCAKTCLFCDREFIMEVVIYTIPVTYTIYTHGLPDIVSCFLKVGMPLLSESNTLVILLYTDYNDIFELTYL